ncbi:MAG: tail fiber protein [Sphingomonas sp.]|uniref:phage tail protein n=1 Tax=Sphingomonas sp. TaxID=28214 RepID=UPI002274EA0F|nr:tail fiber protein [Sphingomonas sp.]MCX8475231.1 tail fiber protein [Sphingomonas sp.]
MAEPFLSELRLFSFNFPPKGWAFCNGQFLPINQNQALFSLLGTMYGGNGQTNFALPNLQGRVPMHFGNGYTLGQAGGEQAHTLTISELPTHMHFLQATTAATNNNIPTNAELLSSTAPNDLYTGAAALTPLAAGTVGNVGGSQAHMNMQPFLTLSWCIALQGIFPSQN